MFELLRQLIIDSLFRSSTMPFALRASPWVRTPFTLSSDILKIPFWYGSSLCTPLGGVVFLTRQMAKRGSLAQPGDVQIGMAETDEYSGLHR